MSPSPSTFEAGEQVPTPESAHSNPGKEAPEVSFIVPCYQSGGTIEETLNSILAQDTSLSFEVLAVESSDDGTAESIWKQFPRVTVLALSSRTYAGRARNLGSARARGSYLAFIDADVVVALEWLEQLHSRLASSSKIRMVSAAVANGNPTAAASRILHWIEFSHYLPGLTSGFCDSLSSSNLLVHRHDFESVGGFDEGMAMAEDLLLSKQLSGRLYFEGSTAVRHYFRLDWVGVRAHLQALGYWSGYYRRHHQGSGSWLRHLPLLSHGLPWFQLPRILGRVFYSNSLQGLSAVGPCCMDHPEGCLIMVFFNTGDNLDAT